nr:MAG TPA: hypothetical protein [Caudoviricetes sp.]
MQSRSGLVNSIKILKMSERPLVFFKLDDQSCLIANHSLNFLADVDDGMHLAIAGELNDRNQFVVKKYGVIGKTKIMIEFDKLSV